MMQLTAESMQLSSLLDRFAEPETLKMAKLGRELRAKGIDIIDLSLGEPDFITPIHIRDAAKKAIDVGYTFYTPIAGFAELRKAVSEKFRRENNLDFTPQQIVVSTGAKQSIANVVLSIVGPGEEVIIPMPYWVSYVEIIKLAEGKTVAVKTTIDSNFKITPKNLRTASIPAGPSNLAIAPKDLSTMKTTRRLRSRMMISR